MGVPNPLRPLTAAEQAQVVRYLPMARAAGARARWLMMDLDDRRQLAALALVEAAIRHESRPYGEGEGFAGWASTVIESRLIDAGRHRLRRAGMAVGPLEFDPAAPEGGGDATDLLALVPEPDRRFLHARYVEGRSTREIGIRFGKSRLSAQRTIMRGLRLLRMALAAKGGD